MASKVFKVVTAADGTLSIDATSVKDATLADAFTSRLNNDTHLTGAMNLVGRGIDIYAGNIGGAMLAGRSFTDAATFGLLQG